VRISGSNAGYTVFRGSVKSTGYPLHSPVPSSLPLPASLCAITFQLESNLAVPTTLYSSSKGLIFIRKTKYEKVFYWYNNSWSHEDVNKANF